MSVIFSLVKGCTYFFLLTVPSLICVRYSFGVGGERFILFVGNGWVFCSMVERKKFGVCDGKEWRKGEAFENIITET